MYLDVKKAEHTQQKLCWSCDKKLLSERGRKMISVINL